MEKHISACLNLTAVGRFFCFSSYEMRILLPEQDDDREVPITALDLKQ